MHWEKGGAFTGEVSAAMLQALQVKHVVIGHSVAEILRGFGMRVLAFDIFPNQEWAAQHGIEYVEARTLAKRKRPHHTAYPFDARDQSHC